MVSTSPVRFTSTRALASLAAALLLGGCSNLLKADFQTYAAGAPPAGLPQSSGSGVTTLLPGAPSGDSMTLSGHGGGTYTVVANPPPAANKGLELGGATSANLCLSSAATFETIPLTSGNYKKDKPTYYSFAVQGGGAGNLRFSVDAALQNPSGGGNPWRELFGFAVRDGQLAELLGSTQRFPAGFTSVTPPGGGSYTVLITTDEVANKWTATFILPPGMNPPGTSGLPRLEGVLRPELNLRVVAPAALSLRAHLADRACVAGVPLRHVIDDVKIGQRQ